MAFFNGMDGIVTFAAGYVVGVKSWDITTEEDHAAFLNWDSADNYEQVLGGAKRWSGSFVCDMDSTTALAETGATGAAVFRAASATQTWEGTIRIKDITQAVQMNADVTEVTYSYTGSSTLTIPDGT